MNKYVLTATWRIEGKVFSHSVGSFPSVEHAEVWADTFGYTYYTIERV